jgi:ABC-2 type transport system permease protein
MRGIFLVARRELGTYLNSLWGYLVVAVILALNGLLFNAFALGDDPKYSAVVLQDFFYFTFGTTLTAAVLLTMRLVAEERQTGTIVLVDSSPLSDWEIVVGKYLSAWVVLAVLVLATLYMPALVFVNGKIAPGQVVAGYLGLLLVASAGAAIGTFGSAAARHQLVAAVISAVLVAFLVLCWLLARIVHPPFADLLSYLSLYDRHFRPFGQGKINLDSVVYFLSLTFVFLMLSARWMAARRWR